MSNYYCDFQQVSITGAIVENTDGTQIDDEFYLIPVLIPVSEVTELLAQYDPSSGTSPLVAVARPLARVILDAIKRAEDDRE